MWKWIVALVLVVGTIAAIVIGQLGKTTGEYVEATIQAPDITRIKLAVPQVEQRVRMHMATKGAYPATLDEVAPLPRVPEGYSFGYEPATGRVWLIKPSQ